LWRYDSFLS